MKGLSGRVTAPLAYVRHRQGKVQVVGLYCRTTGGSILRPKKSEICPEGLTQRPGDSKHLCPRTRPSVHLTRSHHAGVICDLPRRAALPMAENCRPPTAWLRDTKTVDPPLNWNTGEIALLSFTPLVVLSNKLCQPLGIDRTCCKLSPLGPLVYRAHS